MSELDKLNIKYKKLLEKYKRRKIIIIILLIIVLLLIILLTYKIGKIEVEPTSSDSIPKVPVITIKNSDEFNIFNNSLFDGKKIIAPGSKEKVEFWVNNENEQEIQYDLIFSEEMSNKVNMKYKLKMDGNYVRGNEEKYISVNKLGVKDIVLSAKSCNKFELEWYWEDDDFYDTLVGNLIEDQHYQLQISVTGNTIK